MKRILKGKTPTTVFKEILIERPNTDNGELAQAFFEGFPRTGLDAMQYISKWKRAPGKTTAWTMNVSICG